MERKEVKEPEAREFEHCGPPAAVGTCLHNGSCEKFARSTSDKTLYCNPSGLAVPNTAKTCMAAKASNYIYCEEPYKARQVFSMDSANKGQGCVFNCEPSSPSASMEYLDPWPPELTCNKDDPASVFTCKDDKATCSTNIYYDPNSKTGYNSMSSVCLTHPKLRIKESSCKKDDPRNYINCPSDQEAKSYFQKHCFFACEKKKDDGGWNWMLIIIIIAAVVGGLFLLMMMFHHQS